MHRDPVFADPSGRRRRILRRVGLAAVGALAACLAAVLVSMVGGPQAPFTRWADPATAAGPPAAHHPRQHRPAGGALPPGADPVATTSTSAGPTPRPGSATPTPSASTASPTPTNPAGHTPPGKSRPKPTKSPPPGGH